MFKNKIDLEKIPKHIAIIMDGNGRWAKKRGLPRTAGHRAGVKAVRQCVDNCLKLDIKYLSLFAFSTENWKRDKKEVDAIFNLLHEYMNEDLNYFTKNDIKIRTMGDISKLPKELQDKVIEVCKLTENNKKLIVNLGLNYGGKQEIVKAVNDCLKSNKDKITEKDIEEHLYTKGIPEPDLIIRTSGEERLSNFMLFQSAYSELYFPKIYWPDFDLNALIKAIDTFQKRTRRFGGTL